MSSDQQAVIALINRSMLVISELNDTRRANRELEGRLAESQTRVMVLEAQLASASAGQAETPPLRAA